MGENNDTEKEFSANRQRFSKRQGDFKRDDVQTVNIQDIVLEIEALYTKIDQEVTQNTTHSDAEDFANADDAKIEKWSQEIERLCRRAEACPVQNHSDLRTKISLHLSLISKSFLDMRSIEMHSGKILDILDEYNTASNDPKLRLIVS